LLPGINFFKSYGIEIAYNKEKVLFIGFASVKTVSI